jgi:hypothetical protein
VIESLLRRSTCRSPRRIVTLGGIEVLEQGLCVTPACSERVSHLRDRGAAVTPADLDHGGDQLVERRGGEVPVGADAHREAGRLELTPRPARSGLVEAGGLLERHGRVEPVRRPGPAGAMADEVAAPELAPADAPERERDPLARLCFRYGLIVHLDGAHARRDLTRQNDDLVSAGDPARARWPIRP